MARSKGANCSVDTSPVTVACPRCGGALEVRRGRFGPLWSCAQRKTCDFKVDSRPTGARCRHRREGRPCGALMVAGTKTIPDRCSDRSCPNRNPHKL